MKKIAPILLFNFLSMMSMMSILPVIGPIIREVGLQEWHAGIITGTSGVFWMLFARFWGKLSDKKGRRPVLLISVLGFMLSYLALSVFIDITLQQTYASFLTVSMILAIFMLMRSVMGIFFAAAPPTCSAYVADVTTTEKRTAGMALLGASSGFAMIAGPMLAGILSKQSLVLPLYVASFIPILCLLIALFVLPKASLTKDAATNHPIDSTQTNLSKDDSIKLTDKRLRLPIFAGFLSSSCVYSANMCIGFYGLDVLNLSAQQAAATAGYAMAVVGVSMIVIQIVISKLTKVLPIHWLSIGTILGALGFLLVVTINTSAGLYLGYAIAALGIGAIFPSMQSIASQRVSDNEQGLAAGSVAAAQGLAMVIAPVVSTAIYEINPLYPYMTAILLMGILFIFIQTQKTVAIGSYD